MQSSKTCKSSKSSKSRKVAKAANAAKAAKVAKAATVVVCAYALFPRGAGGTSREREWSDGRDKESKMMWPTYTIIS